MLNSNEDFGSAQDTWAKYNQEQAKAQQDNQDRINKLIAEHDAMLEQARLKWEARAKRDAEVKELADIKRTIAEKRRGKPSAKFLALESRIDKIGGFLNRTSKGYELGIIGEDDLNPRIAKNLSEVSTLIDYMVGDYTNSLVISCN